MKTNRILAALSPLALLVAVSCGDDKPAATTPPPSKAVAAHIPAERPMAPSDEEGVPVRLAAGEGGAISGCVKFEGNAPENAKINMASADAYCGSAHSGDVFSETVLAKDGKLANVFVYLKGVKGKFETPTEAKVLNQTGCMYDPHIVAVMKGQKVIVRNSDETSHNIHFLPINNKEDNFSQAKKGLESEKKFDEAEVGGRIKCDVHPWMGAWLHVMKNPFFAVTGADGTFKIANVPPGEYTLIAWHEAADQKNDNKIAAKQAEIKVKVEAGKETTAEFCYSPK